MLQEDEEIGIKYRISICASSKISGKPESISRWLTSQQVYVILVVVTNMGTYRLSWKVKIDGKQHLLSLLPCITNACVELTTPKIIIRPEGINCVQCYLQLTRGGESQHFLLPSAVKPCGGLEATTSPQPSHRLPTEGEGERKPGGSKGQFPCCSVVTQVIPPCLSLTEGYRFHHFRLADER